MEYTSTVKIRTTKDNRKQKLIVCPCVHSIQLVQKKYTCCMAY